MRKTINKNKQFGQGMTEYIIIVALIAVAAIAVMQLFGKTIRAQMAAITQEVAGQNGDASVGQATAAAGKAADEAGKDKGLASYTGNAGAAEVGK